MKLLRALFILACAASAALSLARCGGGKATKTVVVYSPHGTEIEAEIKARFEAKNPGWTVQFIDLAGATILDKVRAEKTRPGADVWWGGMPGDFRKAEAEGLLAPYAPEWSAKLPADAKSAGGMWHATWRTPEVLMYNSKKLSREEVPTAWEGLLDPKWKGRVVIRDVRGSATMRTIFGSMIWREGKRTGNVEDGFAFLKKLDENTGAYAATSQVLNELLAADGPLAITPWNYADAQLQKNHNHLPFDYVLPKDTPVLYEPIALVKDGPNAEGAKLFYDFVTSRDELLWQAEKFDRIPARPDIEPAELPAGMREDLAALQPLAVDWAELDAHGEEWISRWQSEIRTKK